MVNAYADPEFFVREGWVGGGGSKPNAEKTAIPFFMFVFFFFFFFFGPKFSGDAGWGSNYLRVQMLISIEFDGTCDLPGIGVRTPYPPPSGSAHSRHLKTKE